MKNIRLFILGISLMLVGWLTASYTTETKSSTRSKTSPSATDQISSSLVAKGKERGQSSDRKDTQVHPITHPIAQAE